MSATGNEYKKKVHLGDFFKSLKVKLKCIHQIKAWHIHFTDQPAAILQNVQEAAQGSAPTHHCPVQVAVWQEEHPWSGVKTAEKGF